MFNVGSRNSSTKTHCFKQLNQAREEDCSLEAGAKLVGADVS